MGNELILEVIEERLSFCRHLLFYKTPTPGHLRPSLETMQGKLHNSRTNEYEFFLNYQFVNGVWFEKHKQKIQSLHKWILIKELFTSNKYSEAYELFQTEIKPIIDKNSACVFNREHLITTKYQNALREFKCLTNIS